MNPHARTESRAPAIGLMAVMLTAVVGMAVVAKPGPNVAPDEVVPAAEQAVYANDPGYPLANPVDWSRVSAAPVTPGVTVGAYDR